MHEEKNKTRNERYTRGGVGDLKPGMGKAEAGESGI